MSAQTFEAVPQRVDTSFNESTTDILAHATVCNTGKRDIQLYWKILENMAPFGWEPFFCDNNNCYGTTVDSCPINKPVVLSPGQCGLMDFHISSGANVECGKYDVLVWEKGNMDNNLLMSYTFNCDFSSTNNSAFSDVKIYPNPVSDFLRLSDINGISTIRIQDIIGRDVMDMKVNNAIQFDVSNLKKGIYVVSLLSENDQLLKSIRMIKD